MLMNSTQATTRAIPAPESLLTIGANKAASVEVAPGTSVQCMFGTVWLTQEGDQRDHVLAQGATFCTDRTGRVVLSALRERAIVQVINASCRAGVEAAQHAFGGVVRSV
jgi:hypothetical protein